MLQTVTIRVMLTGGLLSGEMLWFRKMSRRSKAKETALGIYLVANERIRKPIWEGLRPTRSASAQVARVNCFIGKHKCVALRDRAKEKFPIIYLLLVY